MSLKGIVSRYALIVAFMMSLSCTCKITAFYLGLPIISQWINVILNAVIVLGCFDLGRRTNAPKAQQALCIVAMLGYIMYSGILLYAPNVHNFILSEMVYSFFIITLVVSIVCFVVIVRQDIKKDEEKLDKLEEFIKNR